MKLARTCPHCGSPLPSEGWEGLCPNCVVRVSLETPASADSGSGISPPAVPPAEPIGKDSGVRPSVDAERSADSPSSASNSQPPPGRLRYFGDYELLKEIARGGMGVVYKARQVSLNRLVAVKMILSGAFASEEFVRRFRQEAEAAANLVHPNIVAIHEVGEHRGQHYFSMDYVEGKNLAEWIADCRLPIADFQRIGRYVKQIAEAIHYAHERGILHRDLKPSNVLIDANDQPRITDFGLAKRLANPEPGTQNPELTLTGQVLGSPSYMPPEQAEGKHRQVTIASDIYSLGAILYHLLAGRPPFAGETLTDTLHQLLHSEPPSPRLLNPGVPRDLETICLKCLNKEPRRRYATAQELAAELGRFLSDEPILARPAGRVEKTWRWCRRNPVVAGLSAAVPLILLAGLAGVLWQWRKTEGALRMAAERAIAESKAKTDANQQRERAEHALMEMQLQRAEDFFAADDPARTVAQLASVLTSHPSNRVAMERLLSALTLRSFGLPLTQELRHRDLVLSAQFSPDGLRVVTLSSDKTAQVWDAQSGKPLTEPLRHESGVYSAQFSPDGRQVVTASDRTARIWDAQTGKPLIEPLRHDGIVNSAQFSPNGLRVVTASDDRTARVWDAQTGKPLTEPLRHEERVWSVQFSPDGLRVVTASFDNTARVWDAQTGKPLTEPLRHEKWVRYAQFSPDGLRVVTASDDGTARLWDAQTGIPLTEPLWHGGHGELVVSAQFSPDGLRVVTASTDKTARLWDAKTGKPLTEPLRHEDAVRSAEFSPDGLRVLTASQDTTARVWDAQTGKPLTERLWHRDWVYSAQFSPDGRRVVTASKDKTARVWEIQEGKPLTNPLRHPGVVGFAEFSRDGLKVVTTTAGLSPPGDSRAQVWDAQNGIPITEPFCQEYGILIAQFSPDGLRVLTTDGSRTARVWDAQTGTPLTGPLRHKAVIYTAQFSPDGLRVVTASLDKSARIWDAITGKPITEPLQHESFVNSAQFSPDGLRVVTACADKTARVWDAQTGKSLLEPFRHEGSDGFVSFAQFSADGLRIVSACGTKAYLWDALTGKPLTAPLKHEASVKARFSPDGLRVVTASEDRTARVWDARTGEPLTEPLRHEKVVRAATFSPDGLRVVTTSTDNTARVWDAQTGKPLSELRHEGRVNSARFSPDGLRVITASADKTARIWELNFGPVPVPPWLPQLAEAAAGKRLTSDGVLLAVPTEEFLKLKEQISMAPATNIYICWAKWFCADRATRTVSPYSPITVPEHIARRIEENSLESLREAVRLAPTNAVALARLAQRVLALSPEEGRRRADEADFLSRRAVGLAPKDSEVLRIRAAVSKEVDDLRHR